MKTTGFNSLEFVTGQNISYYFESFAQTGENYIFSISGDKSFDIKFSGNYIYDHENNLIDYLNTSAKVQFSGNIYSGQYYDLYYNNNPLALKAKTNYNYINKIIIDSKSNELDYSLIVKIIKPNVTLTLPGIYKKYSNITGNFLVDNNSFEIYSGKLSDITPGQYSRNFELSEINLNNRYFVIKTTGVDQTGEYTTYNLNLILDTNIGEISSEFLLTGQNSPLDQNMYIYKLSAIDPTESFSSGEASYIVTSNFLSGSSLASKDISISFSYYTGITGNKTTNIIGTGNYNLTYTGNISGSGFLITNPSLKYIVTGYDPINLNNITGNINYNDTSYHVYTGYFDNSLNLFGTGLTNTTFQLSEDLFGTGINIESTLGSGIVNGSGILTGKKNNLISIGRSNHLIEKSDFFGALKTNQISRSDISGQIETGYIQEFNYFTGTNGISLVNDYNVTGILTGKNQTFYICSGNGISANYTGNLTGSGYLTIVPNFISNFQNLTGYLSGDLTNRTINISLPLSGISYLDYFTGYNEQEIKINLIGTALGYDSLNSGAPVVANVTGYTTIKTGLNYDPIHSGMRYIMINNNLINKSPVQLANYKVNDFNTGTNPLKYISNIYSNKFKTFIAIHSYYAYQNGVNNFISMYTGFNNSWEKIWDINTGWASPAYLTDGVVAIFGSKIVFDYSGNNIIIGCDRCDDSYPTNRSQGQIFTYTRSSNQITTGSKIILNSPYNSYKTKSRFGSSIDINYSGDTMIVGAPNYRYCTGQNNSLIYDCSESDVHPYDIGAAFLYKKNLNGSWNLEKSFHPTNINNLNYNVNFGSSVTINNSGNFVAITSLNENGTKSGSLYLYKKSGTTWDLSNKISGICGGGNKVEFDKSSNIVVFQSGIPNKWDKNWAYSIKNISPIDSLCFLENNNGFFQNIKTVYTGDSSTINNFHITDSNKLIINCSGELNLPSSLELENIGLSSLRSNSSGGYYMDIYTVPNRKYKLRINNPYFPSEVSWPILSEISSATGYTDTFNINNLIVPTLKTGSRFATGLQSLSISADINFASGNGYYFYKSPTEVYTSGYYENINGFKFFPSGWPNGGPSSLMEQNKVFRLPNNFPVYPGSIYTFDGSSAIPIPNVCNLEIIEYLNDNSSKFSIFDISGNYEAEITGDFCTISKSNSYFISNDLTNLVLATGRNFFYTKQLKDIKNIKADYSSLNLKATNIAYSKINDWTPVSNFINLSNTYAVYGTGYVSKNITQNLSGFIIDNKNLLDIYIANNVISSKITEIQNKLFTGAWSGVGISNTINKNITYTLQDSGIKNINNELYYSNPYVFYPSNTLNINAYPSEIKPSGLFSGNFSGNAIGSGYVEKQISGIATGTFKSGNYVSGLNFITGVFKARITGNTLDGNYYNNLNLYGLDSNLKLLTGFIDVFTVTGLVTKSEQINITGYMPFPLSYIKTFNNSFIGIQTGVTYDNVENSLIYYNNQYYTGNSYNQSGDQLLVVKIKKQKLFDDDQISGVLNIKISNSDFPSSFITGSIYESV